MKLTTNYIVYLNELNNVHCAKCRITGRFVKRAIAQNEYIKEYGFYSFSLLTMIFILITMYLTNVVYKLENMMSKVTLGLDGVLSHFNNGKTIVLFTHLNTYLFNSKVNSGKELHSLLNTNEVSKGRVL